jgi:hypothetical protein
VGIWSKEAAMKGLRIVAGFAVLLTALCAQSAYAIDISGSITTTLTITQDSKLVGDVICTVSGLPCIAVGASGVTLDLNGFTMTGQADAQTGCDGGPTTLVATASEDGIFVNAQTGITVRGPGVVRQFRGSGVSLLNSTGATVTGVTASTNCLSGIIAFGGSGHDVNVNVSVRNGNVTFPCGGI